MVSLVSVFNPLALAVSVILGGSRNSQKYIAWGMSSFSAFDCPVPNFPHFLSTVFESSEAPSQNNSFKIIFH